MGVAPNWRGFVRAFCLCKLSIGFHVPFWRLCLRPAKSRFPTASLLRSQIDTLEEPGHWLGNSPNGTLWNVGSDHSGLMLANLMTFAHFSTSAVMKV